MPELWIYKGGDIDMELLIYTTAVGTVLIGIAFLMHIRKGAIDAHGKTRT